MTSLVTSIKDTFTKDESTPASTKGESTPALTATTGSRVTKLTKPFKVPMWLRNMSLETFSKQLQTWREINNEGPEFMKYNNFMESLKVNKDIKDLPHYVGEHVLPILEKKQDQTIKKALELLDIKYGRSRTERVKECVEDLLKF